MIKFKYFSQANGEVEKDIDIECDNLEELNDLLNDEEYEECDENCECDNCKMCCDCDMEYLEEDSEENEDEEFTVDDLCSYVLINKLDNCKTMEEEIEVLKELYEIGLMMDTIRLFKTM